MLFVRPVSTLIMDEALEKIRDFADRAHDGQQRKYTPERYIVHPVRVMEMCRNYGQNLPVLAAALLHDVLEDTEVNTDELQEFLITVMPQKEAGITLKLVQELTDVYVKTDYPEWNRKKRKLMETERIAGTSSLAQTVKYADIIDNCSEIVEHDPQFGARFLSECRNLLKKADKGDQRLYQMAVKTVDEALNNLHRTPHLKSIKI
jgi:(p)ppGpp synthase/HD superfamily hydrolase